MLTGWGWVWFNTYMKLKKPFTVFYGTSSRVIGGFQDFEKYRDAIKFAENNAGAFRKIVKFQINEEGRESQILKRTYGDENKS